MSETEPIERAARARGWHHGRQARICDVADPWAHGTLLRATRFRDFDDYWTPFLGGQAPAPGYAMSLSEDRRTKLREYLRVRLPYDGNQSDPRLTCGVSVLASAV